MIKMSSNETFFDKRITLILVILLIVNAGLSTFAHLFIFHFSVFEWLIMNICAPTSIIASIGLILYVYDQNVTYFLLVVGVLLFPPAIIGFFIIFAQSFEMFQAQITHIIMIISGIYILYFTYKDEIKELKPFLLKGVFPGLIIILMIYLIVFPLFFNANPNIWSKYQI